MEDSPSKINKWLLPFSWLYGVIVKVRNKLFDSGILEERVYPIPIISIGNITVGGTGKTPHTEYLVRLLSKQWRVAVLSRGYKRKSEGFHLATKDTPTSVLGDEPHQIKQKFPNIYVAVDADRRHGIEQLMKETVAPGLDVVLMDDAFQHRYVKPGLNILLVDHNRMLCDDVLLPAGRLREPESGKERANIVIITKCPKDMSPMDFRILTKKMDLYRYQQLYFTTLNYGNLYPLSREGKTHSLGSIQKDVNVLLLTGIASPSKLIEDLKPYNSHVHPLTFPDHHDFTATDLTLLKERFLELPENKRMIITTEKDASRLMNHPLLDEELKPYIFVLPVEISFLQDKEESFKLNISDYVRKNQRNSRLSKAENEYSS